jgi:hypothetical protein
MRKAGVLCTLGPERREPSGCYEGAYVRVQEDLRKTVVFLGHETSDPAKGGIDCFGTGFLLYYEGVPYLITCRHVAEDIGNDPFLIRLNTYRGDSRNHLLDLVSWYYHPDPSVDIAVIPFSVPKDHGYDCFYFNEQIFFPENLIGIGDFCYTVGLFRLLAGRKRNLPVVHFGSIAMVPADETIPVVDWRDSSGQSILQVHGYLVESQSLDGLSGAPVMVRPSFDGPPIISNPGGKPLVPIVPKLARHEVFLLGMWQGAWDAPPDEILAIEKGEDVRVSVGMGVVIPAQKIKEALDQEELRKMRKAQGVLVRTAAKLESVRTIVDHTAAVSSGSDTPPATDANPNHLKDFTRLVDVAARKRPRGDQT